MSINFEEIPSVVEVSEKIVQKTRTVSEELHARQYLLHERSNKCGNIKPFYVKFRKPAHRYYYKYFCVCPRYNPQYVCKHTDNIIVDRDALTRKEHIFYLATPKANFAAPRKMPRYIVKKSIIANCTDRIIRLAKPDTKRVTETLNNFSRLMSRRHKLALNKCLEKPSDIEHTSIQKALELLSEEKRLRKVAKRQERLRCQKLTRKLIHSQRQQIKKIVWLIFENMKEFLLNDQFVMNERSALETVILKALREFTDKEINLTEDLHEYQKILASNLALWISGFVSNMNINTEARSAPQCSEMPQTQTQMEKSIPELSTFLPVEDYILHSPGSGEMCYEQEQKDEDYSEHHQLTSVRTLCNDAPSEP